MGTISTSVWASEVLSLILSQGHSQTHGVSLHAWSEQCLPGTLQGNGCSEDLSYSPCRFSPVLISWTLPYLFLGFQFHFLSLEYLCFAWVAPLYHSLETLCLSNQEQLLGSLFFFPINWFLVSWELLFYIFLASINFWLLQSGE